MAKYTTEVRTICEHYSGLDESKGYSSVGEIIKGARNKIFDFSYPIFDEDYRPLLEEKILKHYYTREIGCETVGLWKMWLNTRLNEIMPYYNQLYGTIVNNFNPEYEVNYTREGRKDENGTVADTGNVEVHGTNTGTTGTVGQTQTTTTDDSVNKTLYSDTPQGGLTGVDNENYLTTYTKVIGDNDGTSTSNASTTRTDNLANSSVTDNDLLKTINNENEYIEHVYGVMNGTNYTKMIREFRKSIINIDMMIIDELKDLFMLVW